MQELLYSSGVLRPLPLLIIKIWRWREDIAKAILWAEAGLCPRVGREPVCCLHSPCPWQDTVFHVPSASWSPYCVTQAPTHTVSPHCLSTYLLGTRAEELMWALLSGSIWRKGTQNPRFLTTASFLYPEVCPEHWATRGEAQGGEVQELSSEFSKQTEEKALHRDCNYLYTWQSLPLQKWQVY